SYQVTSAATADAAILPSPQTMVEDEGASAYLPVGAVVNLDSVLHGTFQHNGDILVSRERLNESQIALNAAMQSCMPEMLRKDTFKRPVAEVTVWRRRVDLAKIENDKLQDAAETYFDWLAALRGEGVCLELIGYEEKVLDRAQRLAKSDEPAKVLVEGISAALEAQQQSVVKARQQAHSAAVKLAYLMGMTCGVPATNDTPGPIDRVDTTLSVEVLVHQAQDNGPGVLEMEGLIASIQQGIDSAHRAQRKCSHGGSPLVCGQLQMSQSQQQQAELSLDALRAQLRAGVESSWVGILDGRGQMAHSAEAVKHAKENYRINELRLVKFGPEENRKNNTYNAVLTSIRQLADVESKYVNAVNDYNKAQARLLLLLNPYRDCAAP
ncbi:MAG: TolC family protein, partial [Gemmataceae bacterium]